MPATLSESSLGISATFSDGSRAEFCLDSGECPSLARDLLLGLVELVHPHGTVDSAGTVTHYLRAARHMLSALARNGFSGGAGELTRAKVTEYWMGTTVWHEACTRRMLQGFDAATGSLPEPVREMAHGRAFNPQRFRRVLPPYSETEWARLSDACAATIEQSFAAHQLALAGASRGEDPATGGWNLENLLWLLSQRGPSTLTQLAAHAGISMKSARGQGGYSEATRGLFPHLEVTAAYVLSFGIHSGIVPDGIGDLVVDDIDWAGDASILLSYIKGRSGPESMTLSRRAVRLLEQWLSHSALLRSFLAPSEARQLWLGIAQEGLRTVSAGPVHRNVICRWAKDQQLRGDDGLLLKIHRHRIRTTYQSLRDTRSWMGSPRATIDPNHSPAVEGDHYLSATTPTQRQAVERIVEDAQHDLLRRAHPPTVLTEEDTAALAEDWAQLISELGPEETVLSELLAGERDVFVAACADQLSGLHGPKGQPCPARPWVCLLCPLAIFAPRHAANLLRLKAFFSRQWRVMPAAQFMAVFGPYAQRIDEVLHRYQPAVLAAASAEVADCDDEMPLRPEELTR